MESGDYMYFYSLLSIPPLSVGSLAPLIWWILIQLNLLYHLFCPPVHPLYWLHLNITPLILLTIYRRWQFHYVYNSFSQEWILTVVQSILFSCTVVEKGFTHSFIFFCFLWAMRICILVCRMEKFPRVLVKREQCNNLTV